MTRRAAPGPRPAADGGAPVPAPSADPAEILEVLLADPAVHPYGIADVAQLWGSSVWWRRGPAVVGLLELPGSPRPVVYAVPAARAAEPTLHLMADLRPRLPDELTVAGPVGVSGRLADTDRSPWVRRATKRHLADPGRLPPADPAAVVLGRGDVDALRDLYATDPRAGGFFHAGLVDTGPYVGIREHGRLVAAAGVHVVEPHHGVAAVANVATRPDHRGRGLATAVVGTLCRRLLDRVGVIGLNVHDDNAAARRLYDRLGFAVAARYEEAELVHR